MPQSAQYEPNDRRLRPITSADTVWWTLAAFAMRNRRLLSIAAVILLAAAIGWSLWAHAREQKQNEAAVAVTAAQTVKDFEAVISRWPGSEAAAQALFYIGDNQFQQANFTQAADIYRRFLSQFPKHPLAAGSQLGLAASLEASNDIPKAIVAYQDLLKNYPNSPYEGEARLSLGRCYELQGDWQKAKQTYEEVTASRTSWANQAKERLLIVERHLRASQGGTPVSPEAPKPAVVPPSPTVAK